MYSSGTIGISSNGATPVTLIKMPSSSAMYNHVIIWNNSTTADGFFSLDGGNTWAYIPKSTANITQYAESWEEHNNNVLIKASVNGDMTSVFGFAEWVKI
ncbi:MAG TPA: hypothetical protein VK797_22965 [Tepidisphaeraceae bacterium]|jgi:hypothetical protein|nr:hypothetical protein [Tepidisphaeraceae bacterium]